MSGAQPRKNRQTRPSRLPDLMIGAVTLALLAGFGTLLLGERNKPVVAQTPPPSAAIPASPGTVPEPQVNAPVTPEPAANGQTTSATGTAGTDGTSAQTATTPSPAGVAQTQEIPPVPTAPPVEETKPQVTPPATPNGTATQAQPPATTSAQTTPAAPAQATTTPATPTTPAATTVATSENRVPLRSDYRISLGSFGTRKTVESQTASVRGLGYTVHAIDLGDQYVAQIGPFADEATARRALADIQRAYPSALLYRPRNQAAETTTSSENTIGTQQDTSSPSSPAATTSSETSTAQPVANSTPAPSGPTYLQVGAFDRAESAERLVSILKDNNFAPTVNSPEGRKTTVMVGPYSGDALIRAEARLDNAGLDHFRVR